MPRRNRAVVSVIGRDQKGVVARVSTYLASCNINIEDIEQRVMEGLFIMTMLVDLSDLECTLDELVLGLKQIGDEIGMEVKLRLAGGPAERKRVAVLVTKEPHCLEQLDPRPRRRSAERRPACWCCRTTPTWSRSRAPPASRSPGARRPTRRRTSTSSWSGSPT